MHDVECQFPKRFPVYVIIVIIGVITDALAHLWMDRLRYHAWSASGKSSAFMVMIKIRLFSSPGCAYVNYVETLFEN